MVDHWYNVWQLFFGTVRRAWATIAVFVLAAVLHQLYHLILAFLTAICFTITVVIVIGLFNWGCIILAHAMGFVQPPRNEQ